MKAFLGKEIMAQDVKASRPQVLGGGKEEAAGKLGYLGLCLHLISWPKDTIVHLRITSSPPTDGMEDPIAQALYSPRLVPLHLFEGH